MGKYFGFEPVDFGDSGSSSSSHFDTVTWDSAAGAVSNAFQPVSWASDGGHFSPVDNYGSRDKLSSHFTPSSVTSDGRGSAFSFHRQINHGVEPIRNLPEPHAYHSAKKSHFSGGGFNSGGFGSSGSSGKSHAFDTSLAWNYKKKKGPFG